jgi:hypothetical protein
VWCLWKGSWIKCIDCLKWIHGIKCSGLAGKLQKVDHSVYLCPRCVEGGSVTGKASREFILSETDRLEIVEKFCYLGDTFGKAGGAEEASRTRVKCAWGKFRELGPILTTRGASLKLKGKIYRACFQRVMVYGSETWAVKVSDMSRLERADNTMVRWMCGVTLRDRRRSVELRESDWVFSVWQRWLCVVG